MLKQSCCDAGKPAECCRDACADLAEQWPPGDPTVKAFSCSPRHLPASGPLVYRSSWHGNNSPCNRSGNERSLSSAADLAQPLSIVLDRFGGILPDLETMSDPAAICQALLGAPKQRCRQQCQAKLSLLLSQGVAQHKPVDCMTFCILTMGGKASWKPPKRKLGCRTVDRPFPACKSCSSSSNPGQQPPSNWQLSAADHVVPLLVSQHPQVDTNAADSSGSVGVRTQPSGPQVSS